MTPRTLLVRGLVAGLVAGLLAFVVAKLIGEPSVAAGIRFEDAQAALAGETPGEELVSRTVQSTAGLLAGCTVFGLALGGLFSFAYGFAAGRLGLLSARATAAVVAALGFLGVHALPALKYPSNPPGVSNGDTIGSRTNEYVAMLAISLLVVIGGTLLARRLVPRLGSWNAALAAGGAGLVVVGLAWALLPAPEATPKGFDADTLWDFRIATSAIQLTLFVGIGLVFGALSERELKRSVAPREAVAA